MSNTDATRRGTRRRPAITEAKLRRLINEELRRQRLIQEGLLDVLKAPFKKMSDKAKKWVLEKATELAQKSSEELQDLKVPDDMREFLASVQQQEGGVSIDEMIGMIPGLADSKEILDSLKDVDFVEMLDASKNESIDFNNARLSYVLAEEKYAQKTEDRDRLDESIALTAATAWYAFAKTVVTTLGLVIFLAEAGEKIMDMMGFKKVGHFLKKVAHFLEKIEEWFMTKAIFPAPVQYAAYLAFTGGKKAIGKGKGQKVLSFKEFQSPENKETKEKVLKALKIALLCVVVVEALMHIGHALQELYHNVLKSAKSLVSGVEHAGIETRNIARVGAELGKAGEAMAGDMRVAAGVAGSRKT